MITTITFQKIMNVLFLIYFNTLNSQLTTDKSYLATLVSCQFVVVSHDPSRLNTLMNASLGISTLPLPMESMRALPFFCFFNNLSLRERSPP